MTDELSPVVQRAYDLGVVDEVLGRMCQTNSERAAMKRVLGVEDQERRVADAFTPDLPPPPEFRPQIDHYARATAAVARYTVWVHSHPDGDPTPLRERERALRSAQLDLRRLTAHPDPLKEGRP